VLNFCTTATRYSSACRRRPVCESFLWTSEEVYETVETSPSRRHWHLAQRALTELMAFEVCCDFAAPQLDHRSQTTRYDEFLRAAIMYLLTFPAPVRRIFRLLPWCCARAAWLCAASLPIMNGRSETLTSDVDYNSCVRSSNYKQT